jgi:hypothetical protein
VEVLQFPGLAAATVGTLLFIAVGVASVRAVRRKVRYETWHLLHVLTYLAIGLRASSRDEILFRDELEEIAEERGAQLSFVIGRSSEPANAITGRSLTAVIPDVAKRDVYICACLRFSGAMRCWQTPASRGAESTRRSSSSDCVSPAEVPARRQAFSASRELRCPAITPSPAPPSRGAELDDVAAATCAMPATTAAQPKGLSSRRSLTTVLAVGQKDGPGHQKHRAANHNEHQAPGIDAERTHPTAPRTSIVIEITIAIRVPFTIGSAFRPNVAWGSVMPCCAACLTRV